MMNYSAIKNQHFLHIVFSFFFVLFCFVIATGSVHAATLKFDKTTVTATPDQSIDVQVIVDAGSDQILGVDSYVTYDPEHWEAVKVKEGDFFSTVMPTIFSGKVYVAGIIDDIGSFKTGSGTLATITFKAKKNATGTLSFYCSDGANDSSKILKNDANATNVIQCANNGSISYTIGAGSPTGNTTPVPTVSKLPSTGMFDSMNSVTIPAVALVLVGLGVKFLIL